MSTTPVILPSAGQRDCPLCEGSGKLDELWFGVAGRRVRDRGRTVYLTAKQRRVYDCLRRRSPHAVHADTLIMVCYGDSPPEHARTILAQIVGRLRRRFGRDRIETVFDFGYRWLDQPE